MHIYFIVIHVQQSSIFNIILASKNYSVFIAFRILDISHKSIMQKEASESSFHLNSIFKFIHVEQVSVLHSFYYTYFTVLTLSLQEQSYCYLDFAACGLDFTSNLRSYRCTTMFSLKVVMLALKFKSLIHILLIFAKCEVAGPNLFISMGVFTCPNIIC